MASLKIQVPREKIEALREVTMSLRQMIAYAQKAVDLSRGRKRSDLDSHPTNNLSVTQLIEIIGKAANRVPEKYQQEHSEVLWMAILGMRNRLIHGNDEVDRNFLWSVVKNDLPDLIIN
jgi:uncharacterized protein with HEPN domain